MPVITTTGRSFAQTARDILTNTNISANAFKLYCLAFTFPKNWKFVRTDLQQRLKFGSANTVKKAVLELIELGLVTGSFTTDLTFYDHSIRSDSLLNSVPNPDSRYISVQPDSTAAHYPPAGPLPQENDRSLSNVSLRTFFRPINVSALDANGLPVSISDSDTSFFDLFSSDGESFFDRSNSESKYLTFPRPKDEEEEDLYDDSPEEALAEAEAAGIDWEIDGYDQMVNKVAKYLKISNINAAFRIRRYRDAMK